MSTTNIGPVPVILRVELGSVSGKGEIHPKPTRKNGQDLQPGDVIAGSEHSRFVVEEITTIGNSPFTVFVRPALGPERDQEVQAGID